MGKAIIIPGEDLYGKNLFRLYVPNVESAKRLVKIKSFEDTKGEVLSVIFSTVSFNPSVLFTN